MVNYAAVVCDSGREPLRQLTGYWLIPAEPVQAHLVSIVRELAQKYHAPVFEPHLTLFSNSETEEHTRDVLRRVAAAHSPVELSVSGIEHSEKFTKTLFVQFSRNEAAQRLSDSVRAASSDPEQEYEFNPHLSLIYADLATETKAAEARRVRLPCDRIRFDAIAAIDFPTPIKTAADVEAWRMIAKTKLIGRRSPPLL